VIRWVLIESLDDMFSFQASGDYDPSFVTEALKEIDSNIPNQDIDLLKDVAAMTYVGQ
jgi:hypothetical protein